MNKIEAAAEIVALAEHRVEIDNWLEQCPFAYGQPFYETAEPRIHRMEHRMIELAQILNDPDVLESIEHAVDEGEYGDFDEGRAFWRYVATWVKGILERMED